MQWHFKNKCSYPFLKYKAIMVCVTNLYAKLLNMNNELLYYFSINMKCLDLSDI